MAVARTVQSSTHCKSHIAPRCLAVVPIIPCHTWDQLSPAGYSSPASFVSHFSRTRMSLELGCEPRPGLPPRTVRWSDLVLPARMARALEVRINLWLGAGKAAPICSSTARNTVIRPGTVWARCVVRNRCGLRRCPPRAKPASRSGAAALRRCLAAWLPGLPGAWSTTRAGLNF